MNNEEYNDTVKKEKKIKLLWTIGIVLIDVVVFLLIIFIGIKILNRNPNIEEETFISVFTVISCLIIVPTIVARDLIIEKFSKYFRQQNAALKEANKIQSEQEYRKSIELRNKYYLPEGVSTAYEYSQKHSDLPTKREWTICITLEILCLVLTIGSVFYGRIVPPIWTIILVCIGLISGIYGFCALCKAYVSGIIYSVCPVLSYAVPLVITYACGITKPMSLILVTIAIGSVVFIGFMLNFVVLPIKRKNKAIDEYYEKFLKDEMFYNILDCSIELSGFAREDGTVAHVCVCLCDCEDNRYYAYLSATVNVNGIKIEDAPIKAEAFDTFEEAEKCALDYVVKERI